MKFIYESSTSIRLHTLKYVSQCAIGKIVFGEWHWYVIHNEPGADLYDNINSILLIFD